MSRKTVALWPVPSDPLPSVPALYFQCLPNGIIFVVHWFFLCPFSWSQPSIFFCSNLRSIWILILSIFRDAQCLWLVAPILLHLLLPTPTLPPAGSNWYNCLWWLQEGSSLVREPPDTLPVPCTEQVLTICLQVNEWMARTVNHNTLFCGIPKSHLIEMRSYILNFHIYALPDLSWGLVTSNSVFC